MSEPDLWQQVARYGSQTREEEQQARVQVQKEHNDKSMLRITLASTFVAVIAALGALWSGYEAHQTRIEDERPFLAVDFTPGSSPEIDSTKAIYPFFHMNLVAFGKSPSKNIELICAMRRNVSPIPSWHDKLIPYAQGLPYIPPSRSVEMECPSHLPDTPIQNGAPGVILMKDFLAFGTATYEDEAGHKYLTPFCEKILSLDGKRTSVRPCDVDVHLPELK